MIGRVVVAAALLHAVPARADLGVRHLSPWVDAGAEPFGNADPYDVQYRRLTDHSNPHYLRVFLEEMGMLGLGVVEYWIDRKRAITNFDYPSLLDRFTFEAWRFDNNGFQINFIGHPLNGMCFHMLARANGMSLPGSVLTAFATSMTWEYGWEFREKVSINDVMVTTSAGTTLGEFVHWMGKYFDSAPAPRPWHKFARWSLGLPDALHGALDHRKTPRPGTTPDSLGFSSDIWHRFQLSAGTVHARTSGDAAENGSPDRMTAPNIRLGAEFVALPGFLREGYSGRTFRDANVTSLKFSLATAPNVVAVDVDSDTFIAGLLTQSIDERGGSATVIGIDLGYRFLQERFGGFTERMGQLHFPGLGIDQYLIRDGVWLRARARLNADFAGVHATAYPAYRATLSETDVDKTILRKQGYYYAWGASTRLDLEVHSRYVAGGLAFRYGRYDSAEGYDRNQEAVTDDVDAHDSTRFAEAWLRVTPLGRMYLEARASDLEREGSVGDHSSDQRLRRLSFALGVSL